jgi:hypothetical protein
MATHRVLRDIKCLGQGHVMIEGSFRPKGTSAPVRVDGHGFTVARTSEGLYTVTLTESYVQMVRAVLGLRVADATATLVQAGDYVAADRTFQIRTLQAGAGSARSKAIQLPLTAARLASRLKTIHLADAGALKVGSTPPTLDTTAGGWAFDADAELAYIRFRAPEDWDAASNLTLRLIWHPQAGSAIANAETVKWKVTRNSVAAGEAVDVGTEVVETVTYTQSGAGTDKAEIRSDNALAYGDANQPIAAGDSVYLQLQRDKTGDTYAGDAVLLRVELAYQVPLPVVSAVEGNADGPYLARVNGATDPAFKLVWPAGDVTPVQLAPMSYPPDLDDAAAVTVNLLAKMSGATDTPVIAVGAYEGVGDTNAGGNTAALAAALAEKSVSIAHGDIGAHPKGLNILLTPGTHANDAVEVYAAWAEYQSTESPNAFALADLADDADNVVSFSLTMRNSSNTTA